MALGAVAMLPLGLATAGSAMFTPDALLRGLGIALLSSAIPYSLELMALRHLASGTFGVLLSLEPAAAALAGLVVLGQVLQPLQLVGMGLVVVASILVLGRGRRRLPTGGTAAPAGGPAPPTAKPQAAD